MVTTTFATLLFSCHQKVFCYESTSLTGKVKKKEKRRKQGREKGKKEGRRERRWDKGEKKEERKGGTQFYLPENTLLTNQYHSQIL